MNFLPGAKESLMNAGIVAARSYHYAKGSAEVGVDPDLASQWGQSVGNNGYWLFRYWVASFTIMFGIGVFVFQGLFVLWFPVHLFAMWVLWRRYKTFRDTDARKRLRYSIPTPAVMAFVAAWFLVMFPISLVVNFLDVGPRPEPTVVEVPSGGGVQPTSDNPYGEGY